MKLAEGSKHQKPAEFPAWSPIWFLQRSGFQGPGAACCQTGLLSKRGFHCSHTSQLGLSQTLDHLRQETPENAQMESP